MEFKFDLRFSTESDLPFIYNSWLKDYRESDFAKFINDKDFFTYHHILIEELIKRPSTSILIACDPEDSNVIYGWLCTEAKTTLHYTYVKSSFRNLGIFKKMLLEANLPIKVENKNDIVDNIISASLYTDRQASVEVKELPKAMDYLTKELPKERGGEIIYTHFTILFYKNFLLKNKHITARYCPYLV